MLTFVSSFICPQLHQSPRIFGNYSIIPSDLVFSLLYSSVVITSDRQEKTISYLTLAQLHLQKKTSRLTKKYELIYCYKMKFFFLLCLHGNF